MELYRKKTFIIVTADGKQILKGDRKSFPKLFPIDDTKNKFKPSVWGTKSSAEYFLKKNQYPADLIITEAQYKLEVDL